MADFLAIDYKHASTWHSCLASSHPAVFFRYGVGLFRDVTRGTDVPCMYQCVYAVLVLSLQVLKIVKCCIAAGWSGSYSDEVSLFRFPTNDSNGASKFGKL